MSAVMLAATLLSPKDRELNWSAGRIASRTSLRKDASDRVLETLYEEWEENGLTDYDQWDFRITLEKVVDIMQEEFDGQEVTYHSYGELEIWVSGGMSFGDTAEVTRAMWSIADFPRVLRAIGFLTTDDITIKQEV